MLRDWSCRDGSVLGEKSAASRMTLSDGGSWLLVHVSSSSEGQF